MDKLDLPDDVIRIGIAARNVAYDELRELDKAVEAFAARVRWDNEPEELSEDDEKWWAEGTAYRPEVKMASIPDRCGDDRAFYDALIRRNADGVERLCRVNWDWFWGPEPRVPTLGPWQYRTAGDTYWWTDGNMGCDCARALTFAQAAGEDDEDTPCGHEAYTVVKAILADGSEILIDDEMVFVKDE